MRAEALEPQMSQMSADVFLNAFICVHLRHLRSTKADNSLREVLERLGVGK